MPELPEVETIRRGLETTIVGKTITEVDVRLPKLFVGDPALLIGKTVQKVRRRGKGLLIDLSDNLTLAIHVKMTGQLVFKKVSNVPKVSKVSREEGMKKVLRNFHPSLPVVGELPNKWTHAVFKLKSEKAKGKIEEAYLFYNDIRQFGWMKIVPTSEAAQLPFFASLGPELPVVLQPDQVSLTKELFTQILSKTTLPIKVVLMDQNRMAGVGNIYANDALFLARIHPLRKAMTLSEREQEKLYSALVEVLKKGIEYGGASEINFINVEGGKGFYQEHFLVYRQDKKPCPICLTPIERIVVAGRGTFFCPQCQH